MHTLTIWIERGWTVHKFDYTFANSSVLIAQLVYPADIFVLLQPFASQLGLANWDMDEYELHVYMMKGRSPIRSNEEGQLSSLLESQLKLDGVSTRQLETILLMMARREWNDVIFVRDVSEEKLAKERCMWSVMEGISHLALTE